MRELTPKQLERVEEVRPTDLHFLCDDISCGNKKIFGLGYAAAVADTQILVEALVEHCTCYDNNGLCEACEALASYRGEK